ncbi:MULTISPECIES: ABC transporter substrate-binding protein [Streptomyces]|uniref:ABC transporter substrate-binding protein n=2 Tax=Streptomyces TaxID=1883 RepID=A0ABU2RP87_9ACTN|nr:MULTISPECIES: ABC transporter substrate-binding protein [unclassified Streptomyces]MBK3596716.1 ABC transporter substrate-binding protein [Streptomyces sp. MBT51]MDT0430670.1 ABC transporter substrate-binding protein [Streptomyces sp. DSM 41770]HBF80624.1 iron transporter [Streptomyces sp.]
MHKLVSTASLGLAAVLTLTGCGAKVVPDDKKTGPRAVTVTNCGEKVTYDKRPERVVTNDVGITELMFALGLEDHMAGYVMPADKGSVDGLPYGDAYDKVKWLSKDRVTKETALSAHADLVFAGWNYGFNENALTPDELHEAGIDTYLLTESCRNARTGTSRGIMPPLDALYTDLENLGRIFGVEERAQKLITQYKATVADVHAKAPEGADRPSVFLYDSGQDQPFTSGRYAAPEQIISEAGGVNLLHDLKDSWTTVGWETVVKRNPDVIVINDYGSTSAEQKKDFLLSYPPLRNVSAIKHERIYTLDYADLVESPRNPSAIERLGAYLRQVADGS